jgi:hypothetical protein
MGDRLRDYGFTNPFRHHIQGSNYDASKAYLSGGGIDQWLTDVSTYNKVLTDFGIQSQIEYKQTDGSWGATPPPNAQTQTITYIPGSRGGTSSSQSRYEVGAPRSSGQYGIPARGQAIETLPEYRWKITGDVAGANAALKSAGLQGSYTTPGGEQSFTGAYIPQTVGGKSVVATGQRSNYGGPAQSQTYYINAGDPLGAGLDGASDAQGRFSGGAAPTFRYAPISTTSQNFWSTTHDIAKEFFADPNVAPLRTDPTRLGQVLSSTPQIRDTIGTYINDTASYWRSRDDGGGALGVIAKGLGGVAQFASMAAGLHGLMAGLGGLVGGAGLKGAFNLGLEAAGGMPDIGGVVGGIAGSPAVGNLVNVGVGGIVGGEAGGVPGALLGAGGAAIGAGIDEAGGVTEFLNNPFGSLGGAFGLTSGNTGGLTAAQISAMEEAAQVGPGSVAENTSASLNPNSLSGNQEFYAPSFGNPDNYMGEVVISAPAGDISQLAGGGFGSAAGGAAGSAIGQILSGNGAAGAGSLDVGGLLDTGAPAIGSSGSPTGNIQSVVPGAGTSMGSGQPGATPYGEVGPEGLPTGQPGSYSDAYGAGMTGGPQGGLLTDMTDEEMLAAAGAGLLGGAALFGGTGSGATGYGTTAAPYGGEVYGTTGYGAGGDGMGGDGTGGDGTGGDGNFRFNFPSFDFGAAPQVMGDLGELLSGGRVGAKTKGGKSPYKRIKSPPRRRGITLRRA